MKRKGLPYLDEMHVMSIEKGRASDATSGSD